MRIHIFGASGSGTTTLANALEQELDYKHLDADDYYWKKTDPPFQEKVPLLDRSTSLMSAIDQYENTVVSGSLVSWGEHWKDVFDLAVFLLIPPEIRIERLIKREVERYGERLKTDPELIETSRAFIQWAKKYDDPCFEGRSITQHNKWIESLKCKVLEIKGDTSVNTRVEQVRKELLEITST